MFSLIITIISIALVAALALATLYYGGSSWTRGNAAATAATVTNQGQQIRGAMELYYADHSAYPASLQDLVTGEYLKTIPVPPAMAALESGLVAPALAAGETWALLAGGQPAFMVQDAIPRDVCQELNYLNLGSDAIREKIDPTKAYQCFGPAAGPFTFISGVPGPDDALASLKQAVIEYNTAHDPDLPMVTDADPTNPVTVAETRSKTVVAGGGAGEGGEEPPAGNPGPLGFYAWPAGPDPDVWPAVPVSVLNWLDYAEDDSPNVYLTSWDEGAAVWGFVSVSNKGGEPLTVNGVSVTAPFFVESETCSGATLPASVDAAAMVWSAATPAEDWEKLCDVSLGFSSSVAGTFSGTLTLLTDDGPRPLPLSAKAADYWTADDLVFYDGGDTSIVSVLWPENYVLGSGSGDEFFVGIRSSRQDEYGVYIESLSTLGPFSVTWTDCNYTMLMRVTDPSQKYANEYCSAWLKFNPTEAGTFSGALIVNGSGAPYGIPVTATAVAGVPQEVSCSLSRDPNSGGYFVFEGGGLSVGVRAYKNLEDQSYYADGLYSAQNLAANLSGVQAIEYEVGLTNDYTGFDKVKVTVLDMQVEDPGPSATTFGLWQGPLYRYETSNGTFHSVPAIAGRSLVNGNVNYFWPAEVAGCGNSGKLCTVRLILDKLRDSLEGQTCYPNTTLVMKVQLEYALDGGTTKTEVLTSRLSLGGAGGY